MCRVIQEPDGNLYGHSAITFGYTANGVTKRL